VYFIDRISLYGTELRIILEGMGLSECVVCRFLIFVMWQYGLAEDSSRSVRKMNPKELTPADLYSLSAVYIAAAHALKPDYPV
jgi:hypothetical protein